MSILARDPVTGALTLIDSALPRDVALDLGAGAYEVLPVGDVIGSVNVLDVIFATAPLVSGSATAGATLTVSGTATSAVAYEYQWLADGVLIPGATTATYATDATADLGKTFTGQMRAQDARGRWTAYVASSNSITIPAPAVYSIPDGEWTAIEDPDDAETRQTYVTATPTVSVPSGKKLRWYKGTTNPTDNSMFVFLTDMTGTGPYIGDSVSAASVGQTIYSRIATTNLDNTGQEWVTSIKSYVTSNVPAAPGTFTATNSTTVTGRVSLDPNNTAPATNGRPILEYGYSQNGGAITAFATGGSATTARDVDFVGIDPIAVRLHARNVNGWSAGSASVSVTPPVITGGTNTIAPEIDSSFYGQAEFSVEVGTWTGGVTTFVIDIEKSDTGSGGWTTHAAAIESSGRWPQTTLDTKYVRAKVTPPVGSAAYSAVYQMKNSPTHVLHFTSDVVDYPVSAPIFGGDLTTGGIWFSFMFYYASGTSPSDGYSFGIGDSTSNTNIFALFGNNGFATLSGTQLQLNTLNLGGAPTDPIGQWYILTLHWYAVGSIHYVRGWRNSVTSVTAGVSRAFTLSGATGWTSLRIGGLAASTRSPAASLKMCGFMAGNGNPEQFHLDTFNDGNFRNPFDYNFATDPNGATKNFGAEGYRVGSATFANSQIADVVGAAGTPTAVQGAPTWTALVPPFVSPTGAATPVQAANIKPLYAPAGTEQSFQYGYGKTLAAALTAAPWATSTSYALDARVTQGGSTYICVTAHTSGTFATDLTAGNWAIYTINSLTHAGYAAGDLRFPAGSTSLGNILPTVTNGIYTCTTPGTITANVTCGKIITTPSVWTASTSYTIGQKVRTGTPEIYYECAVAHTSASAFTTNLAEGFWQFVYGAVNIVSNLYEPQTMPASPREATTHDGNGLLCAFDPYPTPAAAGTTYANVAALASGIGAVGAGGYLCVANLTDTGTDLTIPAGDYAGATIEAKNLYGVNVGNIILHNVRNLTLRGFKGAYFQSGQSSPFQTGTQGLWIDHCFGTGFNFTAMTRGAGRLRVSNWQSPDDATATRHWVSWFQEVLFFKVAVGKAGVSNANDRVYLSNLDRFIGDRVYVGSYGGTGDGNHVDLIQPILSGVGGFFGGYFINSAAIEPVANVQGAFFADGLTRYKDFWLDSFIGFGNMTNTINLDTAISNTAVQNCFGTVGVVIKSKSLANSAYAENNVKGAAGPVLGTAPTGTEINTYSTSNLGVSMTTIFPQYSAYPTSWRAFANPAGGYTTAGPATFIAELEAKRVALGI